MEYKKSYNILCLNMFSDSTQLFTGKHFGKYIEYKPFKNISPNKTLVGYLGGFIITFIFSKIFFTFNNIDIAIIIISGFFGDLFASKIKRQFNIKDFEIKNIKLLGSHGGFLDRFDSFVLSNITYFLYDRFS